MNRFFNKEILNKKVYWWITYPVLIIFSLTVFSTWAYFYVPRALSASYMPKPFEGHVTDIEYNCLCSGGFIITVQPNTNWGTQNMGGQKRIMYFWAADAISRIFDVGGPRIYQWYQIFYPNDAQLLGNYIEAQVPCMAYAGTGCTLNGYADAILIGVGTSKP